MYNGSKCCCGSGCVLSMTAKTLLIVGGLNWGLVGASMLLGSATSWNLVKMIFGSMPVVEGVVYVLVGVSALVSIFGCRCAKCKSGVCETCAGGEKSAEAKM